MTARQFQAPRSRRTRSIRGSTHRRRIRPGSGITGSAARITTPSTARSGTNSWPFSPVRRISRAIPGPFSGGRSGYLAAEAGIRQFLDIGTGLPTADNTHEVAQRVAPESRIVYVDNDPLVLVHARALLTSDPRGATDLHRRRSPRPGQDPGRSGQDPGLRPAGRGDHAGDPRSHPRLRRSRADRGPHRGRAGAGQLPGHQRRDERPVGRLGQRAGRGLGPGPRHRPLRRGLGRPVPPAHSRADRGFLRATWNWWTRVWSPFPSGARKPARTGCCRPRSTRSAASPGSPRDPRIIVAKTPGASGVFWPAMCLSRPGRCGRPSRAPGAGA